LAWRPVELWAGRPAELWPGLGDGLGAGPRLGTLPNIFTWIQALDTPKGELAHWFAHLAGYAKEPLAVVALAEDSNLLLRDQLARQPNLRAMLVDLQCRRIFDEIFASKVRPKDADRQLKRAARRPPPIDLQHLHFPHFAAAPLEGHRPVHAHVTPDWGDPQLHFGTPSVHYP
jgi:hypothetical protein